MEDSDGRQHLIKGQRLMNEVFPWPTYTAYAAGTFGGHLPGDLTHPLYQTIPGSLPSPSVIHVAPGEYDQAVTVPAGITLVCSPGVTIRPTGSVTWGIDCEGSILGYPNVDMSAATSATGAVRIKGSGTVRVEIGNTRYHLSDRDQINLVDTVNASLCVIRSGIVRFNSTGRTLATIARCRDVFMEAGDNAITIGSLEREIRMIGGVNDLRVAHHTNDGSINGAGVGEWKDGTLKLSGLRHTFNDTARNLIRIANSAVVTLHDCWIENTNATFSALEIDGNSSTIVRIQDCQFKGPATRVLHMGVFGAVLIQGSTIINTAATASPSYGVELKTGYVTNTLMTRNSHVIIKSSGATRNGFFANNAKNATQAGGTCVTHASNANLTWNIGPPIVNTTGMIEV
jgi:hypothetical protein